MTKLIKWIRNFKPPFVLSCVLTLLFGAASLVAVLSLQTAMFSAYGAGEDTIFKPLMNMLTGTVVCVFLIVLGILTITRSNKELKQINTSDIKTEELI